MGSGREITGRSSLGGPSHNACRSVKEVKTKKKISQKIIKQIEIHILHVVALAHKEILIHENT